MIKYNRKQLESKIYGCWLGKNIGGTMGTPYEGRKAMLDIKGFVTKPGEVLPNDDLDLQLIWLMAAEIEGLTKLDANILAEYWASFIPANWNEYGVGKNNLKAGFMPPLSGEYENEMWKDSNGAWIRSEIWACMAPGFPNIAAKYAFADACIDHGVAEGTYAEIFTACLESYAFFESDIRKLVELALARIPADCEVAKCVKLVLENYDKGVDYREVREMLVKDFKDEDWFQAPENVAYVVIGLMYGEGDFKKTMIYAINCGDDTDCTGATVGAILGIVYGRDGIPSDWAEYLGDNIVTVAIDRTNIAHLMPKTCTELTDRVMKMIPSMFKAYGIDMEYTDGETDISDEKAQNTLVGIEKKLFARLPYSYDGPDNMCVGSIVEFFEKPSISEGESIKVRIRFFNKVYDQRHLNIKVILPESWTCSPYKRDVYLNQQIYHMPAEGYAWEITLTAGERVEPMNRAIVQVTVPGRPTTLLIPITIAG